ncbi:MAG: ATP-binding cassette domain-containing protein [Lachnospiraceae bacterium]|nr:ATP-binding cassette domain-containing protein [Lachnospiraceae bacterium]
MENSVKISGLSFSYGEKKIFDSLDLVIPAEGITAVSGASGCGKTTLLRMIAGLEKADCGQIEAPPSEEIAFMFQEDRLLPGVTAAKQLKIAVPDCDASRWLETVGLKGEEKTLPDKLSGGMRRRLALARTLCFSKGKKLVILDEPFAGVDPARIRELMPLIRKLDIPVIMSAHTEEALALADRVLELRPVSSS